MSMLARRMLELGCGTAPTPGYIHHDRRGHSPHVEVVHDLDKLPWPWLDAGCAEILALDVFEHLHLMPEVCLRECDRILMPGGHHTASDRPNSPCTAFQAAERYPHRQPSPTAIKPASKAAPRAAVDRRMKVLASSLSTPRRNPSRSPWSGFALKRSV
jgi:hypothetical protein